jgi:hypothetical protein
VFGYSFEGYLVNGSKDIGRHAVYCYVVWVCAMQLLLDALLHSLLFAATWWLVGPDSSAA